MAAAFSLLAMTKTIPSAVKTIKARHDKGSAKDDSMLKTTLRIKKDSAA